MKTAVSRLSFAPKPGDMKVTDVKNGHFVFSPRPAKPVAYGELAKSVTKAGYEIEDAWITVRGKLAGEGRIEAAGTGQVFALSAALPSGNGGDAAAALRAAPPGSTVEVVGRWHPGAKPGAADTIEVRSLKVGP